MKTILFSLGIFSLTAFATAPKARVFFVEPKDGAEVSSPVKVVMGVEGMKVAPAGSSGADTGHHHILVDRDVIAKGSVVPVAETSIHYGKGQTEDKLKLKPGPHTLTLQFADGVHSSYGPDMSATIRITVK